MIAELVAGLVFEIIGVLLYAHNWIPVKEANLFISIALFIIGNWFVMRSNAY